MNAPVLDPARNPCGASFEAALEHTFREEGSTFTDDPADHGGPTRFGVTLDTLRHALGKGADFNHDGLVDAADVQLLTKERAAGIYRIAYWDAPGFDRIRDQWIAMKAFDLGVHAGPATAVTLLQRAIDHAKPLDVAPVKDDGQLGPKTLAALDACDAQIVLAAYCSEQAGFYLRIIEHDPTQEKYRAGWLARSRWPLREFGELA